MPLDADDYPHVAEVEELVDLRDVEALIETITTALETQGHCGLCALRIAFVMLLMRTVDFDGELTQLDVERYLATWTREIASDLVKRAQQ